SSEENPATSTWAKRAQIGGRGHHYICPQGARSEPLRPFPGRSREGKKRHRAAARAGPGSAGLGYTGDGILAEDASRYLDGARVGASELPEQVPTGLPRIDAV